MFLWRWCLFLCCCFLFVVVLFRFFLGFLFVWRRWFLDNYFLRIIYLFLCGFRLCNICLVVVAAAVIVSVNGGGGVVIVSEVCVEMG